MVNLKNRERDNGAADGQGHPISVAVVGLGHVGRYAVEAVQAAPDMVLAGVVRRNPTRPEWLSKDVPVVADIRQLTINGRHVDVALLCTPTRQVEAQAKAILPRGIHTVDSFDIHGDGLIHLRRELHGVARQHEAVAILSAGWDPGTDSMVRALFELMAPGGITYTNFGPGMSMGHTVAAKAVAGVRDALSMTLPTGAGVHRRLVYVELEEGANFSDVEAAIQKDAYFVRDDTRVVAVESVKPLMDVGHGTRIERKGVSGQTHNQHFQYDMRINNPALTSQVMVSAARATLRQQPGAYTMLEVPLIDFLPGDKETLLHRLV